MKEPRRGSYFAVYKLELGVHVPEEQSCADPSRSVPPSAAVPHGPEPGIRRGCTLAFLRSPLWRCLARATLALLTFLKENER